MLQQMKSSISQTSQLNEWDSKVGDGDYGTTLFRGASTILEDTKKGYPLNDAAQTVKEIGMSIRRVMGGTSGILYDILCKAAYVSIKGTPVVSSKQWANALEAAIVVVSKYGGAGAGYHTMLDALIPATTVLKEVASMPYRKKKFLLESLMAYFISDS